MYRRIPVHGQVELVSMISDIALYQGKSTVHAHMVIGLPDGTTKGGHVLDEHVSPTLEVMVTVDLIFASARDLNEHSEDIGMDEVRVIANG
jgi:predicted DNA-binding protein with PD1-like motif